MGQKKASDKMSVSMLTRIFTLSCVLHAVMAVSLEEIHKMIELEDEDLHEHFAGKLAKHFPNHEDLETSVAPLLKKDGDASDLIFGTTMLQLFEEMKFPL